MKKLICVLMAALMAIGSAAAEQTEESATFQAQSYKKRKEQVLWT